MKRIEFSVAAKTDIAAFHARVHKQRITAEQLEAHMKTVEESLEKFEETYKDVAYIANNSPHLFTGLSSGNEGDRYPKRTLVFVFERSGSSYRIFSPSEKALSPSYNRMRLIEEAKHIEQSLPDIHDD
jgi:hypothetical protein